MVDSMQNGVGIFFSKKYACASEKIYTCSVKRKKVVPDHVFCTKKNGGDISFVSLYETTTTKCDASVCCLWKEGNSAL